MRKIIIIALWVIVGKATMFAQTSNVRLLDLCVVPDMGYTQQDSVELTVLFKISDVAQSSTASFCLSSSQDNVCDLIVVEAVFIEENGEYYLKYNNSQWKVENYQVQFVTQMLKPDFDLWKQLRVYVVDKSGAETERLLITN